MSEKLLNFIIKNLTIMPGVTGIANADFSKSNVSLKEENYYKGIAIETSPKGISVSIAIIVDTDANVRVISKEISQTVKSRAAQEGIKVVRTRVYIRGVK